jgi:transcriptional regulator with XRE-family HTH domain
MVASSTVQQARQQIAGRLREIRLDAGLTKRAVAAEAGWHESKCSRIEHARTPPSDADIRAWCGIAAYIRALLKAVRDRRPNLVDDIEQAVEVRVATQHVTCEGDHQFTIVLEENVLFAAPDCRASPCSLDATPTHITCYHWVVIVVVRMKLCLHYLVTSGILASWLTCVHFMMI